MEINLFMGTKN